MYLPRHFAQHDDEQILRFMRATRVADLVTHSAEGLTASLIPFVHVPDGSHGTLRGHVARANDQWRSVGSGAAALAIFRGPDAYVSPRWYPAKNETGRVVPTWNYAVVHVYGRVVVHDDPEWTRQVVIALTDEMERKSPAPWSIDDAPADYVDRMVKAIVGVEVQIDRIEAKWKLSQNQPQREASGVLAGLEESDEPDAQRVAAMMREVPPS